MHDHVVGCVWTGETYGEEDAVGGEDGLYLEYTGKVEDFGFVCAPLGGSGADPEEDVVGEGWREGVEGPGVIGVDEYYEAGSFGD